MSMKYFSDKEGVNNGSISFKISADLTPEQDAAHANLGGNWRTPTKAEFNPFPKTWCFGFASDSQIVYFCSVFYGLSVRGVCEGV